MYRSGSSLEVLVGMILLFDGWGGGKDAGLGRGIAQRRECVILRWGLLGEGGSRWCSNTPPCRTMKPAARMGYPDGYYMCGATA